MVRPNYHALGVKFEYDHFKAVAVDGKISLIWVETRLNLWQFTHVFYKTYALL